MRICSNRLKIQRILSIQKGVLRSCQYTHNNSIIDRKLEYSTPEWLDDINVVTRGSKQDHERKLFDILNKLEKAGYRASKKSPNSS